MISIIIPYVKDRGYLNEALISVWSQFGSWEVIHARGNHTQGANINRGLKKAKGDYIKILHDDDMLPSNSLEDLFRAIHGNGWACGDAQTFGDKVFCPNPQIYKGCVPELDKMIIENQVYGGTTLYRKDMLVKAGGYNEDLWTGEEYDLHLRLLHLGYKCTYTPKVVHRYRLHEFNKSYYMGPGEKKERREYIREIAKRYV